MFGDNVPDIGPKIKTKTISRRIKYKALLNANVFAF
jgi:hypothetical protein